MRIAAARQAGMSILAALLTACGGSGGAGDVALTDADFVGTYFAVRLGGTGTAGDTNGATGTVTGDGAGTADLTLTVNNGGGISGPATFGFLYDVAADGRLDFRSGGPPFERGGLAQDGGCALLASSGGSPSVLLLMRKGGVHGLASLSGSYHIAGLFGFESGGTQAYAGPVTFDGAGVLLLIDVSVNTMGSIGTESAAFPYTVAPDGTSTLTIGADYSGGVVEGGAAALWGGSSTAGEPPAAHVVVRAATSAGVATFQGEYWSVCLVRDLSSGKFAAQTGTVTANGSGSATLLLTTNLDGVILPAVPIGATYAVAADGALTLSTGTALRGGISQDGRFAVLGGATTAGSDPTICILRRK